MFLLSFYPTLATPFENIFMIHPLVFWGKTPFFLLGCLTSGIGGYYWYKAQGNERRKRK